MRSIADLGEFGLIERIRRAAERLPQPQVVLGIGDDAAVLRPRAGEDVVVSTDSLVEGVHFRFRAESATRIGQRALVANLSDLAAMGARPLAFTLAFVAPPELPTKSVDGLLRGLLKTAGEYTCPLVGGNLSRGRETSLAITVMGAVARGRELRRHRVHAGDRLLVTGTLGGSALAVARAERSGRNTGRLPEPRLGAGRALVRLGLRCACIDVSDGLSADLAHLLEDSRLGAQVDAESLPLARGLSAGCARLGLDPVELAACGGEDYELLFALPARGSGSLAALERRLGVRVSEIGRVVRQPGVRGLPQGQKGGWTHF